MYIIINPWFAQCFIMDFLSFERKMFETSRNMRERWDAIRVLINRSKNNTINCPIKHSLLGEHFSTIATKLNSKLPNIDCEIVKSDKRLTIKRLTIKDFRETSYVYTHVIELSFIL